jgi:hypothetical protein
MGKEKTEKEIESLTPNPSPVREGSQRVIIIRFNDNNDNKV